MRKVPPGIQIIFGGADGSGRSTSATSLSSTHASHYRCSEQTISAPSALPGLTDRRHHEDDVFRPHSSVIELDRHSVCGIHRAFIPALHPDVARPVDPRPRRLADFIDEIEVPSVLGDKGRTSYACASGDALKLTGQSRSDAG